MPLEPEPRPDWAHRLREARRARGWDVARLARELRRAGGRDASATAQSLVRMIRDWEKGTYRPRERYRLLLARLLEVDLDHQEGAPAPGLLELPGSGRAEEVATAVRATSAHIVALDARFGARDLVEVAVRAAAQAHRTAQARFNTDREVLAAAAEAQQIAGWVAFDAERQDLSRRMSLEALLSARSAGDRSMEQFVLGQLAMQDAHLHRPVEAAQICSAALEEGAKGSVRTMFTLRAARAAAQMGEHARARDLIEATHSSYLDGPRDRDPAWAWWLSQAEICWHHAMIHADIGQWTQAVELFAAACRPSAGYAWAASIYRASLLWALAHAQAWDEAETVLVRDVLPHQGEVASVRTERTLARAARLLDGASGRPSLRESARQLTAAP
ncbi:DNA-binding protein [Nocardiopsis dassonvillei]|uniref:DNA-binding protein n=1 Tax=Nocardiopsis dassonvillei TaxID=2014 RepID=UPI00200CA956|nr:DNA-binding protein [Nocardiopsis dassonvillei]MCK9871368.1 DNA-binding protein [Nocardiopsis dassonvillei]